MNLLPTTLPFIRTLALNGLALLFITAPGTANEADKALTMMTFNVRHGTANDGPDHWRERRADLLNFLSSNPADILLLQETVATQVREIRDVLPQHATVTRGREDGRWNGEHVPILFCNGFDPERIHGRPIDFIYTSPGFKVESSEIVLEKTASGRWLSDHFPVRALLRMERININPSATPPVP